MQGLMEEASRKRFHHENGAVGNGAVAHQRWQADARGRLSGFINRRRRKTLEDKRGEIEEKVEAALREGRKIGA